MGIWKETREARKSARYLADRGFLVVMGSTAQKIAKQIGSDSKCQRCGHGSTQYAYKDPRPEFGTGDWNKVCLVCINRVKGEVADTSQSRPN